MDADVTDVPGVAAHARSSVPLFAWQLAAVFVAYFVAGKLGQAPAEIRSSNLGPVWPAYGVALAAFLACGSRIWPAIAAGAFVVALQSPVPAGAAAGQAGAATAAAATGAFLLRRIRGFDPSLDRLRDALALIAIGAFGSSLISATVGIGSLYATGIQPYTGLTSAWLVYWLGDSTGVLLVTPLAFTLPRLMEIRSPGRIAEFVTLLAMLAVACLLVFGEWPVLPMAVHGLPFIVLPFVVWGAIRFGVAGGTLAVLLVATIATVLTALGIGPFSTNTPLVNAVLLDALFAVLSLSALSLAAVMAERQWAESERVRLMRERVESDARLRFAAIVESSDDAIVSVSAEGRVLTWNGSAGRILGINEADAIGRQSGTLVRPEVWGDETGIGDRIARGERIFYVEGSRVTAEGQTMQLLSTISPLRDSTGAVVGSARIVRDVSQQKEAERELSGFNRRLIDAQEQERAKIARELHDDLGQRLALLTSRLAEVSTDLQAQAAEIADDLQALSRELHPSKIDLLGITASMRFFCRDFAQERGVRVEFDARDVPSRLPWDLSVTLYRILQEALHNVAKHSGVRQCRVQLWAAGSVIHLRIEDRGAGFDVQAAKRGRGIGLISMEERIKLVDGSLTVESSPGRGAAVYARAPFDAPALG